MIPIHDRIKYPHTFKKTNYVDKDAEIINKMLKNYDKEELEKLFNFVFKITKVKHVTEVFYNSARTIEFKIYIEGYYKEFIINFDPE
jgi:hypothetical protein